MVDRRNPQPDWPGSFIALLFGLTILAWTVGWPGVVVADEVEISNGGHLAGAITKQVDTGKMPYVVVQVDEDIQVAIQKSRIRRVRLGKDLGNYPAQAAEAGDDPEKHYWLAVKCKELHLEYQYRYHMQRAIALDPDHSKARASLKYVKDDNGNWVMYSSQQRNRGMVLSSNGWHYPEAVAKQRMRDEFKVKSAKWTKDIARHRSIYLRGSKTSGEAWAALKAISDPVAAGAIANELERSRETKYAQPRDLRLLWIDLLGQFRNTTATAALVKTGLDENDSVVREAAMKKLKVYGYRSANATYSAMLNPKKNSNKTIRKALRGMSYFPDPALAMTYVNALVTVHKKVGPQPTGNTNAAFTSDNGGSFSTGSKQVAVDVPYRNDDAHRLLVAIEPSADYGFNQQAWREHFARKLTQFSGSLRRDP